MYQKKKVDTLIGKFKRETKTITNYGIFNFEKKEGTFISILNEFEFFYIQLKKVEKSRPLFDDLMTTFVLSKIKNGNFHLHNLDNNNYKNIESAN